MRLVNEFEKKIIYDFFSQISINLKENLEKKDLLLIISLRDYITNKDYPLIFLVSDVVIKKIKEIKSVNIISAGIFFGFIKRNIFYLSIEGAEFLKDLDLIPEDKIIYINNKGEKAVLYGNHIKKSMILKGPEHISSFDVIFVYNQSNELISISHFQINSKMLLNYPENDVLANNLIDRGYYLRKKQ